tara:strand:- start:758 stop:2455 length:1698 start_codon:yes stop_codon:yes gene_type:complete
MSGNPIHKDHKLFSLYYDKDGFDIKGEKLMGRQAAGWSFFKAIVNSKRYNNLGVLIRNNDQKGFLLNDIKSLLSKDNKSIDVTTIPFMEPYKCSSYGGLQLPGPDLIEFSTYRSFFGHEKYSLSGITHTTASHSVMSSISSILTEPIMPWDSIICTSKSVLNTVNKILEAKSEFLNIKFNSSSTILPKFPIIPLGINCEDFNFSEQYRKSARKELLINDDDIVIAYVGRLSFHAKSHHVPMYLALENLSKKLKKNQKIHLIQTGWFANDFIENSFKDETNIICPSVNCIFLDGRNQDLKFKTLASADIFMSLSDNIQETFGLTPLEAMASSIPVIVSDWNGYRSTVRDGKDGFLIPSYSLGNGFGEELMFQYTSGYIDYDNYIGNIVHKVAIDIKICIDKLTELIENPNLRNKLGKNGKKRANDFFSWNVILNNYEDLYSELDNIRVKEFSKHRDISVKSLPSDKLDPFYLFDDYPTEIINDDFEFYYSLKINSLNIKEILNLNSTKYAYSIPKIADFNKIIDVLKINSFNNISDIIIKTKLDKEIVSKVIIFLFKYGYLSKAEI